MARCLIAESSDVIRKALRRYVEEVGFEVIEADNGSEVLEIFNSERPDVMIIDNRISGGATVIEILSAIRFSKATPAPYIIYLTTDNDLEELTHAHHAGAHAVLLKPADRESVIRIMSRFEAAAA